MTEQEIAAKKIKVFVLFGLAVAAFIASYIFPGDELQGSLVGLAFVCFGVICLVFGGKIAKSLKTESAAK
jgi:ABC-type sulfate transport system permease subunit